MGVDFIHQNKRHFRRAFDGGRAALADPGLFPSEHEEDEQLVLFDVHDGTTLAEGDMLVVQIDGEHLVASRGDGVVATAGEPPASIMAAMRNTSGYALVRVARVSTLSGTADLAFRLQ
jgi:hypothetical protein